MTTSRERRAMKRAAAKGEVYRGGTANPARSGHSTRERKVIDAVACPVCEVAIGVPCRPLSVGDRVIIESGRLFVHGDRRRAWQMLRSGEMTESEE